MLWYPLTLTLGLAVSATSWSTDRQEISNEARQLEPRAPHSHLTDLDVVCSKEYMTVNMQFDQPFQGVVFSHAAQHHQRCVHIGPHAGVREATFRIRYDSCGTTEDAQGHFHENTIVVQFETDILEAWDEAKRLRCEWLTDFEKPSSKPTVRISELDIVELNFQGDDIECWMEIQEGKGPWSRQLDGLVLLGSPLTLVIAINDHNKEFDMKVKQCDAKDGTGHTIPLTDERGCVLRPTLLTPFLKVRDFGTKATLLAFSYLYAFKFPDSLDVYIRCTVEVCRHGCVNSCPGQTNDKLKLSPRDPAHIFKGGIHAGELSKGLHHQAFLKHYETRQHAKTASYHSPNVKPGIPRETELSNANSLNHVFQESSVKTTSYNQSHYLSSDGFREEDPPPLSHVHSEVEHEIHSEVKHEIHSEVKHEIHSEVNAVVPIGGTYVGVTKQKRLHPHNSFPFNGEPLPEPEPHLSSQPHSDHSHSLSHHKHWSGSHLKHVNHPLDQNREFRPPKASITQHQIIPQPEPEPEPSPQHSYHHLGHKETEYSIQSDISVHHPKSANYQDHPRGFPSLDYNTAAQRNIPQPQPEPEPSLSHFPQPQPEPEPSLSHVPQPQPEPEPSVSHSPQHIVIEQNEPLPETEEDITVYHAKLVPESFFETFYSSEAGLLRYTPPPTTTDYAPVYIPNQQMNNMNTSKQMMMMMMSSMKPMYPPSYMNSMSTLSKLRQNHYPYPIPQFGPNKAMMMLNVVADRRADDNAEDLQVEDRPPISGFASPVQPRTFETGEDVTERKIIHGPRMLRVKRSEPVFGVQQKFRVISPADLAFELNTTTDGMAIFKGRREEIVYGVCMSTVKMGVSVSILLFLTICSMTVATVLYHKHQQLKMRKPVGESPFSRMFNGQVEHVYKPRASRRAQKSVNIIEIS